MTESHAALKKLDAIFNLLETQVTLTEQLVEMQRNPPRTASTTELDEESRTPDSLIHRIYELHVPEQPPVGTVVLGRNDTTIVRKSSGWQVTGSIMTSPWVDVLQHLGPVKVIHTGAAAPS